MKKTCLIIGALTVLCVGVLYYIRVPSHGPSGIFLTACGWQTNASGGGVPLYAISNGSSRALMVLRCVEVSKAPRTIDHRGYLPQPLQPGAQIVFAFTNAPSARPVVNCWREPWTGDWYSQGRKLFFAFVLKEESGLVYASQ